jgi:hypothetical protein
MYRDYGVDLRDIVTLVQCPDCLRKFTVRLGVNFLSRHVGEPIAVICVSCAQSRMVEINKTEVN